MAIKKKTKGTRKVVRSVAKSAALATKGVVPFALPDLSAEQFQQTLQTLGACYHGRSQFEGKGVASVYRTATVNNWLWITARLAWSGVFVDKKIKRAFGGKKRALAAREAASKAGSKYFNSVKNVSWNKMDAIKVAVYKKYYTVKGLK